MRIVEAGGALGLLEEAVAGGRVVAQGRGHALEGDSAPKLAVTSAIDLAHSPAAQALTDTKSADRQAGPGRNRGDGLRRPRFQLRHGNTSPAAGPNRGPARERVMASPAKIVARKRRRWEAIPQEQPFFSFRMGLRDGFAQDFHTCTKNGH